MYFIRSLSELEAAQMDFYLENASLCREQKKVVSQKLKTLTAQEAFFIAATKKLSQDNISSLLDILTEQYVFLLFICINYLLLLLNLAVCFLFVFLLNKVMIVYTIMPLFHI
jgi:hypothetical protein